MNAIASSSLIGALVLIVSAIATSLVLSLITKSWLFQLDILYLPRLTSNILGLISIIYALKNHEDVLSKFSPLTHYAIAALVLSIASVFVYAILYLITLRKIYIVRARDAMHRPTVSDKAPGYLPEHDQQRKQLLRLLLQQEDRKTADFESATQHTFKIDWPGTKNQSRRNSMSTLRYIPKTMHGSQRSSMSGASVDHLTGGIERVPFTIEEEPERCVPQMINCQPSSILDPPIDLSFEGVSTSILKQSPVSLIFGSPTSKPVSSTTQSLLPTGSGPAPLKPVAYVPPSHIARYMGLDSPLELTTPLSGLPSYRADAHPSLNIATRPLSHLQENGYPLEKQEPAVYAMPQIKEPRPI